MIKKPTVKSEIRASGFSIGDIKEIYNDTVLVYTDHSDGVYSKGDSIYFDLEVVKNKTPLSGEVSYKITNDGEKLLHNGTIELRNGKAQIAWHQDSPMIVRCEVSYESEAGQYYTGMAAAAVDPFQIKPTAKEPFDFMGFWMNEIKVLDDIPVNEVLHPITNDQEEVEVFDIRLDNVDGSKVYAYFGRPKGKGPFPALLTIPGAGVNSASIKQAKSYASKGFLVLSVNIHNLPNSRSKEFYNQQKNNALKEYYLQGRTNKEDYYFYRVLLGNIRAIDYLTSLDEWDKEHLVVNGSSQGGGLALMTTGLDSRVTAAAVNVPAFCDHRGREFGRPSGWPQLAFNEEMDKLDSEFLKTAEYYEAVNFSRRIKVPVAFGVGLIDGTCSPTTVLSAYNVIQGQKEIVIEPTMGHEYNPPYEKLLNSFITKQGGEK